MEREERAAAFRQTRNTGVPGRTETRKENGKFGNTSQYNEEEPKESATFESKDLENNDVRDAEDAVVRK